MLFRSHGKLMITGEYLVLAGARCLAMPVCFGQSMHVQRTAHGGGLQLEWISRVRGAQWLHVVFTGPEWRIDHQPGSGELPGNKVSDRQMASARFIRSVLQAAQSCSGDFLSGGGGWRVVSELDFDLSWGLGSSSSLISNIAWWADISPFELFFKTSGGSAYDIACARSHQPILFTYKGRHRLPDFQPVMFNPPFSDKLVFVYSGNKQSSAESLMGFDPRSVNREQRRMISSISERMCVTGSLQEFMQAMHHHEAITAGVLKKNPVQPDRFDDFPGAIKSLGAWGGDFLLAASDRPQEETIAYFRQRRHDPIIPFNDMIQSS